MVAYREKVLEDAEAALTAACEHAVEDGIRLIYDGYGVRAVGNGWSMGDEKEACVLGYLAYKKGAPSDRPVRTWFAESMGIPWSWALFMEAGFGGWEEHPDNEVSADGYQTGLRLREKYNPSRSKV